MESKEIEYVVDPKSGSVFKKEVTKVLTEVFATKKSFEDSLEVFIPLLKRDYDLIYVSAKLTGRTLYYIHYCPTLKYLAEFKFTTGKKLIPVDPTRGDYVNQKPLMITNWIDEKGDKYRLFFIHKVVYSTSGDEAERRAFMVLIRRSDSKVFLPPIANIYDDARICFGNSSPRYSNKNFPSIDDYEYFTNSRANFDLAPRGYGEFATFDLEGKHLGIINSGYLRPVSPTVDPKIWEELKKWT